MKDVIKDRTFDTERALYNLTNTKVQRCIFAGPADGESAFKESHDIEVDKCRFELRYPFWHASDFVISNSEMTVTCRAPLWYASNATISDSILNGVKTLRECSAITINNCSVVSPEFGWKCNDLVFNNCDMESEYYLFECKDVSINNLKMRGKYSFQYTENVHIKNSVLNTKDAFWHCKNVTAENCEINGEYLAWYSDGLTLINCTISGTQPLCYCKNLRLIDCKMNGTDLSFEYSDVCADIIGEIESVKNPRSGYINADSISAIITEGSIMDSTCVITERKA